MLAPGLGRMLPWTMGLKKPVGVQESVDFLAPGKGPLTASATLSEAEIARIKAAAAPDAKVPFVLEAEVLGEDGTLVARTRGDYQLRPFGR